MYFVNIIRQLRKQSGTTQSRLAECAGTSQPTIAAYESGRKSPTWHTVNRLAQAVDLEIWVSFVPRFTREDLRSIAYHDAIVAKLDADPFGVIGHAKRNVSRLKQLHPDARQLLDRWERWLDLPVDELRAHMLDPSLTARDMRQVSPFSGILCAAERLRVIKDFQERWQHEQSAV